MEEILNHMRVSFDARSVNEGLARMLVAAFMTDMNPTLEQMADVKTAVSEAVTNAIIHGYNDEEGNGQVLLVCERKGRELTVQIEDKGVGIADIEAARQPFYTTKPELERSGMGFSFMEAFMDRMEVTSVPGEGTCVTLWKYIAEGGEK